MATKKKAAKDPCWQGYEKIGMKMKNGKLVPNCVPKEKRKQNPNRLLIFLREVV